MSKIITHPGSAHKDDFLSTCVLLASLPGASVHRHEPSRAELDDPQVYVVDVGMEYDPEKHNFDHHQDASLPCGFHLVMQHLGYHDAAQKVYLWYQHLNMIDLRGPDKTAEHLGIDTDVLYTTSSPIEGYILSRFAAVSELYPGDILYGLMQDLGREKLDLVDLKIKRLEQLQSEARVELIGAHKVLVSAIAENPKLSLELYLRQLDDDAIVVSIFPSSRGPGWELLRIRGDSMVDFRLIEGEDGVRFVHHRGFMAKTVEGLSVEQTLALTAKALASPRSET